MGFIFLLMGCVQTAVDKTGSESIPQPKTPSEVFVQKFEELVNQRNNIDRKIPYPYQVTEEVRKKLVAEYQKKLPPGTPNLIQEEEKLIAEYKNKLKSGEITPNQMKEELKKKLLNLYQQKFSSGKTTPNLIQEEARKKLIAEIQQKLKSGDTKSSQIQEELRKKLTDEYQQKLNETELNQVQKELLNRLNQSITVYASKKRAYIQDLNKRAVTLQQDIGKLPKEHQAIAKQTLTEFITLTKTEDKLFDHLSKLIPNFKSNKLTSQANGCTNYFKQILGISQVYAQSDNCSCQVSTEYLNPRLIKITTKCVCLIYIQYKQTFTQVTRLQKQFNNSWKKFKKLVNSKHVKNTNKTGTVWDSIRSTQPVNPNTTIPKSFELSVGKSKYWVHPNATKHLAEYSTKTLSHGNRMTDQALLTSFRGAVEQATKQGIKYDEMMIVGNWELIISKPRAEGQLPVIKHALYIP
jgi:hypothetical protein